MRKIFTVNGKYFPRLKLEHFFTHDISKNKTLKYNILRFSQSITYMFFLFCIHIGELSEYYRAVQAMDHDINLSQEQSYEKSRDFMKETETEAQQTAPSPQKTFKVKPFSEIVRLQRPHVTRKQPNKYAIETAARLKTTSQSETARSSARTETTQREREMIYGIVLNFILIVFVKKST